MNVIEEDSDSLGIGDEKTVGIAVETKKDGIESVENITQCFTAEYEPQLQHLRAKTEELTKNQKVLLTILEQENQKYTKNTDIDQFNDMISTVESYYIKLTNIKTDMRNLDDRLSKLKKRSLRLKERRLKQDLDEQQKQEQRLVLEQELTAKPAS